MSNNLLTISMITNEALMVLENELTFAKGANRDYDPQFAVTGAKIGATVNVRKPARFIGTTGPALNVEDFNETSIPVTLTTQFHVDTQFTTADLTLSMDMFADRVLKPQVAAIANKMDSDGLVMAKNATANIVGTPDTPSSALLTYLTGAAIMDAEATPRDGKRSIVIDPFTNAAIVDGLKGLFTPSTKIGDQYTRGLMGRDASGLDWKLDQNVVSQTFSNWTTIAGTLTAATNAGFAGSISTGWATNSTITLTNSQGITLNQGDTFTIAGVFATNPQNRRSYGRLRSFVVNSTVTAAAGTFAVNVSPAIITAGQFQNVVVTATSGTATVTPFNIALTAANAIVSPQNIIYHRNAFTMACADLLLPDGVHFAGRASDKQTGLSIRVVRQYTINNDALPCRLDVLYGWAPLYPECACRVAA